MADGNSRVPLDAPLEHGRSGKPLLVSSVPERLERPDTVKDLLDDAQVLFLARRILTDRFTTGKHDGSAHELRMAGAELLSRARHPSREWSAADIELLAAEMFPEQFAAIDDEHPMDPELVKQVHDELRVRRTAGKWA